MQPQFVPQSQLFSPSQRRRILAASISANLFANVSMSGLNVALPAIENALDLSAVVMVWVASSLLLATGPGLCGILVELLGWPSVFWLTSLSLALPLALLLSVGARFRPQAPTGITTIWGPLFRCFPSA